MDSNENKDEEITAIANRIIRTEFPLLTSHYVKYDVNCIRRAMNEYKGRTIASKKTKKT